MLHLLSRGSVPIGVGLEYIRLNELRGPWIGMCLQRLTFDLQPLQ